MFDAECILCNKSVQYILKHDSKKIFQFASLQSDFGQQTLKKYNLPTDSYSTVLFLQDEKLFSKSTAALRAFSMLSAFRKIALCLLIIPTPIRDLVYTIIAKNRKRFFKNEISCLIPTEELKDKML